jgi:nucleoside-diphosphate-sugar epimerase/putative sterol carrier protein
MKVAVTGGSGQLGTLVLRNLGADRSVSEIVSIDLKPPRVAIKKLRAVSADVRDPKIADHFQGCDALIHMAFVVTGPSGPEFNAINVGGSRNVFDAAISAGVKRIVYASSIAAYGVVPGHPVPIVETTPRVYQPAFAYSATKFLVEEYLDEIEARAPDVAIVRLRPAILIGAHMEHALGDGLRRRVMVHLGGTTPMPIVWDEDVADAAVLAVKSDVRGAFNLAADEPLSVEDLAAAGGLRVIHPPPAVMSGARRVLPWLSRLHIGRASDPAWLENLDVPMIISSAKAREVLGWQPRCPTAVDVIRYYAETVPSRTDPRLLVFFRLLPFASSSRDLPADAKRMDAQLHLALTGPTGGDFDIELRQGRLSVRPGVPRPPSASVSMKATVFLDLLSGRTDFATAQMTGKVRVEGEALATMIVRGLVTKFRQVAAEAGVRAWPARRLSDWLSRQEAKA